MNLTRSACPPGSMMRLRACCAGPLPGGMLGDPEDADAPGGVAGHGQDTGLGAVGQADREEVARQDRAGECGAGTRCAIAVRSPRWRETAR
jgi:hypothetical protein